MTKVPVQYVSEIDYNSGESVSVGYRNEVVACARVTDGSTRDNPATTLPGGC